MKRTNIYSLGMLTACITCLFAVSCTNRSSLPIGSLAEADSLLTPRGNEYESGQYTKALHFVDSAFYSRQKHTVFEWVVYFETHAYINAIYSNTYEQLKYLDSAIALLQDYKNDPQLLDRLSGLFMSRGDAQFNLKKYASSYEDFFKAIQLARQYPEVCRKMHVPYSIGMILYRQQQFANSAKYFTESLQFIDSCEKNIAYRNNKKQEVLDNIGLCYTKIEKYDSAMYYYQQAMDLVVQNPYSMAVDSINSLARYTSAKGVIAGNMAKVFLGKGNTDSAIALYKRAIKLNEGPGHDLHDMQLCMVQLSEIYVSKNMLGPLNETLQRLRRCLDTAAAKDIQTEYERLMYAYYEKNNEPAKAFPYLASYIHKKDSATEQQKQMLQTDISKELKDKQQQFEIALLQKDNQLNKTYLLVLVGLAVLIIIILVLIYTMYRSSKKNVRRLTELNAEISGRRQSLELALKKLENANLEKDRILRVVAHDLRNPIGGIVTLSNMMIEGNMVNERSMAIVEAISSASVSSIGLIQELMNTGYADVTDTTKTKVDIGGLLHNVVNLVQYKAAEKKQHIELQLPVSQVTMMIHPGQLERVVNNLLVNAIKFSPEGKDIVLSLRADKEGIQIAVRDQGIGMPGSLLEHIFEGSSSLKRTGTAGEKSFGLGLSICRQIVEEMGGTIRAESEEGVGSVFYVELRF
ncbi:MAG: tetratricopeptide repeat-containing sensor histidine kinase [Bacteroidota bacterium]